MSSSGNITNIGFSVSVGQEGSQGRLKAAANTILVMLALVGVLFAFMDGITRPFDNSFEYVQEEALSHEARPAAGIFGLLMLPLVWLYVRRSRGITQEAGLLWLVLCTVAYSRDFAYFHIPGIPLYIADYVLGWLIVSLFLWPKLRWLPWRHPPIPGVMTLMAVGLLAAARGVAGGQETIVVFRDLGMVAYAAFLVVGLAMFRNWRSVERLLIMVCLGGACLSVNALGWFINAPGQRRYIAQNSAGSLIVLGFVILVAASPRLLPGWVRWSASAVLGIGIVMANSRGLYVSLGAALGLILLFGPGLETKTISARLKVMAAVLLIGIAAMVATSQTRAGAAFLERSQEEFISGVIHPTEDENAQFRFTAWLEALARFAQNPIMGEGYGVPFTFGIYVTDPRPHNTYLTFLYKTGIIGFAVIMTVLGGFFLRSWRVMRRFRRVREADLLYALTLALVATLCTGIFTFVFESPYICLVVWLCLAAGYRMMSLLRRTGEGQEASHAAA